MTNILITGGAGFVGSSLALNLKKNYPDKHIICLDNLKRKGSELNLKRLFDSHIEFVHGDIRNKEDFDVLPKIDLLIEASAEPSVLAGLNGSTPDYLLNTNLVGTINCLNFAVKNKARFVFLSTSRVYPIKTIEGLEFEEQESRFALKNEQKVPGASSKGISEDFPLAAARSLYGTSKLASELLIQEYHEFYGLETVVNRCGVLTGPWQMGKIDQGVMVLWAAKHHFKQSLAYIGYGGSGKQTRDMLHVDDLFDLLDWQLTHFDQVNGQTYNAGGGTEVSASLNELTALCQKYSGNTIEIRRETQNRPADIRLYITDNSKITALSGWKPKRNMDVIVSEICTWLKDYEDLVAPILK